VEAERDAKEAVLKPEVSTVEEKFFERFFPREKMERVLGRVDGLSYRFGGLMTGAGFSLGPDYTLHNPGRTMRFRARARGSTRLYYSLNTGFDLLYLLNGRAFASVDFTRRHLPEMDYYGPGPDSVVTGRSNFLMEDTAIDTRLGLRLRRNLTLGVTAGGLQVNVGPGRDQRLISTDLQFPDAVTPGIAEQPHFLRSGGFLHYDTREDPDGPRSGSNWRAEFTQYWDRRLSAFSFQRIDLDVQQYVPFFNERRVFALRGRMQLSNARDGNRVPFFLQPVFGGAEMGRGYRRFRFYDDNMLGFTGEYRWEVFSGLDLAVFADAGKVFSRSRELNLRDLESSVGAGLRFNARNKVLFRLDTGVSHEGVQVWLRFDNVF
jgi:hypothetical protein